MPRRGIITTVAGTGEAAYCGDGGPAARAGLAEPNGLAFDAGRRLLYITDVADNRVRVVDLAAGHDRDLRRHRRGRAWRRRRPGAAAGTFGARAVKVGAGRHGLHPRTAGQQPARRRPATGIITTIAGTTARGYGGDGGPALAAVFDAPKEMAIDRDGSLLIVDTENHAIRRIDRATGIVTTIAGGRQGRRRRRRPGRPRPGSTGRMARSSARTARSISATPTTTASARWCEKLSLAGGKGDGEGKWVCEQSSI